LRKTGRHRIAIVRKARAAGIRHGVVPDKRFLPGLRKLKRLIDSGFFGRILAVRGEFGYWVFEGDLQPAQRPSWNYRREDGGGMVLDMLCHWRYVLDNVFGKVLSVSCLAATHIGERVDEAGERYKATADDAAYATFQLEGDIIAHFNCSWATRVRRDELRVPPGVVEVERHAERARAAGVEGIADVEGVAQGVDARTFGTLHRMQRLDGERHGEHSRIVQGRGNAQSRGLHLIAPGTDGGDAAASARLDDLEQSELLSQSHGIDREMRELA
jgi:predicted dehydrogenase